MGGSASTPSPEFTRSQLAEALVDSGFSVVHQDDYRLVVNRDGSVPYEGRMQLRVPRDARLKLEEVEQLLEKQGEDPDQVVVAIVEVRRHTD